MIRANLLPRPKERIAIAGIDVDAALLRQLAYGCAIVAIVAAIGIAIATLRVARLEAAVREQDDIIAAHAARRADIKTLAQEVGRYQNFAREAEAYRRSGNDAAVAVARIGNGVPDRVWLTTLAFESGGYRVAGGAASVDRLGGAVIALGTALPGARASLISIDNHAREHGDDRSGVRFSARVALASGAAPEASP